MMATKQLPTHAADLLNSKVVSIENPTCIIGIHFTVLVQFAYGLQNFSVCD